jgi:hypothetical protein
MLVFLLYSEQILHNRIQIG